MSEDRKYSINQKPHFYIVKLGFTGVYIIFLTSTHTLCFEQKFEKISDFLFANFHFLVVKFLVYLNRHVMNLIQFELIQFEPDTKKKKKKKVNIVYLEKQTY